MQFRPLLCVPLLLTAGLAAQSYTVSPSAFTNTPGGNSNTIPFWSATHRYQQIHGDMKGTPRVILGMSLRKGTSTSSSGIARTLDVEVSMCNSNFAASSTTFAANYVGTPVVVLPRQTVNLPDWTFSQGTPEPWSIVIPYTTPWPYTGQNDLLWEWVIHSTTSTGSYFADAYSGSNADRANATIVNLGTGCLATGKTSVMSQTLTCYTTTSNKKLNFGLSGANAPNSVPAAVMVGPVNPNLTVPGLCEKVFVVPLWTLPVTTSASGGISVPLFQADYDPNWAGAKLYVQSVAVDVGQSGLPFALSRGQEATLPVLSPGAYPIQRIWSNSNTATTGSKETYAYGLVTRFTH